VGESPLLDEGGKFCLCASWLVYHFLGGGVNDVRGEQKLSFALMALIDIPNDTTLYSTDVLYTLYPTKSPYSDTFTFLST